MINSQIPFATLSNGKKMPMVGFGTYQLTDGDKSYKSICAALEAGYRHIDTASLYDNEATVGKAIRNCGIDRSELFVVTKMWNSEHGYEKALKAFDDSLERLGLDYVDLYLIHWPKPQYIETWRAFESIYESGRAKSIGVSNFQPHHLETLKKTAKVMPMVNQVEFHPYLVQKNLLDYCHKNGIQMQAWSPLMHGRIVDVPFLQQLSIKYQRSISQIVLRWNVEMSVVTIPKSANLQRMKENLDLWSFDLEASDIDKITQLDKNKRFGADPDNFDF